MKSRSPITRTRCGRPRRSRSAPTAATRLACFRPRSSAMKTRSMKGWARHRRHHLYRRLVCRLDPQAALDHRRAIHSARLRPLEGLSRQPIVPRPCQGLRGQDQAQGRRDHLLRPAPRDRQQGNQEARRHEGHEAARAAGAAVPDVHEIGRRQRHADRLRRSLPGAPAGHGGRPGKSAADHHGEESSTKCSRTSC